MKITFWWQTSFGELAPACETDTRYHGESSLLSRLLLNGGGDRYINTLPELNAGLQSVEMVKQGKADSIDWDREDWGARLNREGATIYFICDEQCAETMDLDSFEKALRAWVEFIQTQPDPHATKTIEI